MSRQDSLRAVNDWMYRNGGPPTDGDIVEAINCLTEDWLESRRNGMSVLFDAVLEELIEIIKSVKDLI